MSLLFAFRDRRAGGKSLSPEEYARAMRMARRLYLPRIFGLAIGGICVAAVFYENGSDFWFWLGLIANGLIWPHLAFAHAQWSADPHRAELRNLMIDSFLGGIWLPVMNFNLLPSIVLTSMLSMDNISVGGLRLLLKGFVAQALGAGLAVLLFDVQFRPASSMTVLIACAPMLFLYPLVIGWVAYGLARRLRRKNLELEAMSRTDRLTGINNRGYWEEIVVGEFRRFLRGGEIPSLLLVDVDHFKQVNDRHGHPVGDRVLKAVARVLDEEIRDIDVLGRYGGEEFGIVLMSTEREGALRIAERLRRRFETAILDEVEKIQLTISVGIAELTADTTTYSHWVERADQALYRAKQLGRNRVEVWTAAR